MMPPDPSNIVEVKTSFDELITLPSRARPSTSKVKRSKPPSSYLTSEAHFDYVRNRAKGPGKGKRPEKRKKTEKTENLCSICGVKYGDKEDPKRDEEWMACKSCKKWYHLTCGEDNGILDDDESYHCKDCL